MANAYTRWLSDTFKLAAASVPVGSYLELGDVPYSQWFADGVSPENAAKQLVELVKGVNQDERDEV